MTIEERLLFIRAGYSAQDIAAFEAAEDKPAALVDDPASANDLAPADDPVPAGDPAADPVLAEDMPAWAKALKASLDEVKKTIQSDNRRFDDMGDEDSIVDAAENALAKYITGEAPVKSNHGGKHK